MINCNQDKGGRQMAFYEELSRYYDHVFPFSPMTYNFLSDRFPNKGKILDIATGTGNYAITLAENEHKVTAIDLDKEMIQKLKEKIKGRDLPLTPVVMNMLNLNSLTPNSYDGAFCIGNSLVHLQTLEAIEQSLKEVYNLLLSGGQFIIQVVNYDRILAHDIKELPLINRPDVGVKFLRRYQLLDDIIHFNTRLIVSDGQTYDNSITLYPLTSSNLKELLLSAGFRDIHFYGGFDEQKFNLDAFPLIVTAKK